MRCILILSYLLCMIMACDKPTSETAGVPFEKTYGGPLVDYATGAIVLDEQIYMVGTTKSLQAFSGGLSLTKIDASGAVLFEKSYGGTVLDFGTNICTTLDGNLLLVGMTSLPTASGTQVDVFILKVATNGDTLWTKTYGDVNQFDVAEGLLETDNGEILILGSTYNGATNDFKLLRLDGQGNLLWQKIYNSPYNDEGINIASAGNDEYLLLGRRQDGDDDFYVMKIDEQGTLIWENSYGTPQYEQAHSISKTSDGNFLLCGHSSGLDPLHHLYLTKITTDGLVLYEKQYGGLAHDGGTSAIESSNGNLLLVGETNSYGNGSKRAFFLETDARGTVLEELSFGGDLSDKFSAIVETDEAYYLIGESASFSSTGTADIYVVKRVK
ncbi:MAG: Unknown protein [uncultured Aureispira sp.]|uniref:Uncharacterized protein n=1 Tax=uncultured Aureispira sp. TaxID=1331704 RepID=A0A6S6U1F2_9BACT|nr:MAG: Unknown protein [uncultured Aureispira sp.]